MRKITALGILFLMFSISACQSAPDANAEATQPTAELRNTLWKLTELEGKAVQVGEGQKMASLTLNSEDLRARIVTACNSGSATFSVEGNAIKFGMAISTKMMCPDDQMQQEAAFFRVVRAAARFEIKGETLVLFDADDKVLARFHSEYLN